MAHRRSIPLVVPALAAVALACGDGVTTPDAGAEIDVESAAESVRSVSGASEANRDLMATLELASRRLADAGSLSSSTSVFGTLGWRPRVDAGVLAALARASEAEVGDEEEEESGGDGALADGLRSSLVVPESLMGETLVWNPETDSYEIDPERPGAPESGVRVIIYEIDPETGVPAEPLVEIGHVDLVDESTSDSGLRVAVRAVDTSGSSDVVLADYVVEGSLVISGGAELDLSARGFLSDGTDRLDFDLAQEVTVAAGASTAEGSTTYVVSLADGATVTLATEGTFDLETGEPTALTASLVVESGEDTVVLDVAVGEDGSLDGTVSVNGDTVVEIGGTVEEPAFSRPDGGELTREQREALRDLFEAVEELLAFAESVFGVAGAAQA